MTLGVWSMAYKIVTQKQVAFESLCIMDAATTDHVVQTLFSTHPMRVETVFNDVADIPLFGDGQDSLPLPAAAMYNACLTVGVFILALKLRA